ncbi:hypothetical protein [Salipaludibacillus neizhouensis]|uniref:hypothetical protein n=1 Tax=Salipaludibacillus neizhouensis TaxID=885475 RepID=UPI0015FFBB79|nr:hypothetical protein [Salipaludibacillus neizhouensis]
MNDTQVVASIIKKKKKWPPVMGAISNLNTDYPFSSQTYYYQIISIEHNEPTGGGPV